MAYKSCGYIRRTSFSAGQIKKKKKSIKSKLDEISITNLINGNTFNLHNNLLNNNNRYMKVTQKLLIGIAW